MVDKLVKCSYGNCWEKDNNVICTGCNQLIKVEKDMDYHSNELYHFGLEHWHTKCILGYYGDGYGGVGLVNTLATNCSKLDNDLREVTVKKLDIQITLCEFVKESGEYNKSVGRVIEVCEALIEQNKLNSDMNAKIKHLIDNLKYNLKQITYLNKKSQDLIEKEVGF